MRTLAIIVAAGVFMPGMLSADTYPRQPSIDAIHYRFAIALADDLSRIQAEASTTFRLVSPAASVELDLVSASGDKGMIVTAVMMNGRPADFTHHASRLRLAVPPDAKPGQDLTYTITYSGEPAASFVRRDTMYGEPSVFSDNWPDRVRHWLPMIDHPYDKATGELIVTAPAQFQVVSNGTLVEEVDLSNGQRRTHWKQSVPIASWLFAVGVARFDLHHAGSVQGVPLQTWLFPQDRVQGRALFEETSRRAVDFFSDRVGPYPYEKLANVEAAGLGGAMENATTIFYGERGVASGRAPVVHEIAHQWFGNSVTERDWDDVWLSEGFATYFTHLYTEYFEGPDALVRDLQQGRMTVLKLEKELPNTPVIHRNLADMDRVLNQLVYQKGGWILHMLRAEVGTEVFWEAIRTYYRRYRDRNASTDDLRQVMEQVSGKDLTWFFSQWLTRSGVPRIEGWWRYAADKQAVEVTLLQPQSLQPFRLTVEVALLDSAGAIAKVERVSFDSSQATFLVSASAPPGSVSLDPNTWLLADLGPIARAQ